MQHRKQLFRDITILLIGLLGLTWFFYSFWNHHPLKVGKAHLSKSQIVEKADSVLQSWQFSSVEFYEGADLKSHRYFIDSLQYKLTDGRFSENVANVQFLNQLPFLYWTVEQSLFSGENNDARVNFRLSTIGEVVAFEANSEFIHQNRPFNRYAVRSVFQDQVDNYSRAYEDSLISGLTNYQHLNSSSDIRDDNTELGLLRGLPGEDDARYYTKDNIWKLGSFYLNRTHWEKLGLQKDSVKILDDGGVRFARTFWSKRNSETGSKVALTLELLPAGSIKSLNYELSPQISSYQSDEWGIAETISIFLIIVFAIWLLFVFYLRIKARAIDTGPALIIAVLAGFIVPGIWILNFIDSAGLAISNIGSDELINGALAIAVMGAVSAVGFFVLTAVSDSVTRQYWPDKLKTWDFVRRGLFMNKPVGWAIVHALGIGGCLAGISTLVMILFPESYISAESGFISNEYYFPSIANLLMTSMMVLLTLVPVFLIAGNQIRGLLKQNWIIPVLSAFLFGIINIIPFELYPESASRLANSLTGFLLGYFYLRYDILPVVFGYFLFINLLTTSKGWVIDGSPDYNTFLLFLMVFASMMVLGLYFIAKGSDRSEIPEYVPEYIEEQAKEQRLKQELSIARIVQQTFLPSKIHRLPGIDIAGICIPAQETGGDYYDMIPLGEQRTAIAIGDVSGKGIKASFYMTFTKGVLHSLSALILSPVELLNQLNRLFNENATRGTFISMIYGILEADKRQFTFARAGHNPMLVVRENGDTEWIKPDGVGIGVTDGDRFIKCTKEATLKIHEGDVVILYTDGVTEMLNPGNQFYGEQHLERLVKGVRKASSEKIMEIIVDDVKEFKGVAKQHDDMTLVIIKADESVNQ
jgi:hypothetical protein